MNEEFDKAVEKLRDELIKHFELNEIATFLDRILRKIFKGERK